MPTAARWGGECGGGWRWPFPANAIISAGVPGCGNIPVWRRPARSRGYLTTDTNDDGLKSTGWQQADAIYDVQFRPLEAELKGKFLVLDSNAGDYKIDEKHVPAWLRMLERHPAEDERAFYSLRIGYHTI